MDFFAETNLTIKYYPHKGFTPSFIDAVNTASRNIAFATPTGGLKKKKVNLDKDDYSPYFLKPFRDLAPFKSDSLVSGVSAVVFVKDFNYSLFTFRRLATDQQVHAWARGEEVDSPYSLLNCALFLTTIAFDTPINVFTFVQARIETIKNTFDIDYIIDFIAQYLSIYQLAYDVNNYNEAGRKMITNIFIMLVSAMASMEFSVGINLKDWIIEKRLGNGTFDYFLQHSDRATKILNLSEMQRRLMKSNDSQPVLPLETFPVPCIIHTGSYQTKHDDDDDFDNDAFECNICNGYVEKVIGRKEVALPAANGRGSVYKEVLWPLSINESISDRLQRPNLDSRLGHLVAQMIDALKSEQVQQRKESGSKYLWVKGMLSTGQRTLFFAMRKEREVTGAIPDLFYCGQTVVQVLPLPGNVSIRKKQVESLVLNMYAFLTAESDAIIETSVKSTEAAGESESNKRGKTELGSSVASVTEKDV